MVRDEIETALRSKLQSASPVNAVVCFDLGADGMVVLDGKAKPPAVSEHGPKPGTTIKVSAADLQAMLAGQLSPIEAYSTGRLDVAGDMGVAMQLNSLLSG